jgi:hypothetical protein
MSFFLCIYGKLCFTLFIGGNLDVLLQVILLVYYSTKYKHKLILLLLNTIKNYYVKYKRKECEEFCFWLL